MINLNGTPKSGTFALIKAVELLAVPVMRGDAAKMWRASNAPTGPGAVFIYRHPKNALISIVRQERNQVVTQGFLVSRMPGWHSAWLEFAHYLTDPDTLAIRLGDLLVNESVHQAIAAHIGVPYIAGAHAELPGGTFSYNAVPSIWSTNVNWTPLVQQAWVDNQGPAIEAAFGYV